MVAMSIWLMRQLCAVTVAVPVALVPAALVPVALPGPGEAPGPDRLAGQLLVAAPEMSDPHFAETVILMVRHDATGAFGIVINRPVDERSLASMMRALGESDA